MIEVAAMLVAAILAAFVALVDALVFVVGGDSHEPSASAAWYD